MEKFHINITRRPNQKKPTAEIFYGNLRWAEISQETEKLTIQFYKNPNQNYWEFSCDESLKILKQAKEKLLAMGDLTT